MAASCKHGNEATSSITGSAFIDWATHCPVLEELTLRLLMSYIFGAPSKARNANVVYIWTYDFRVFNSCASEEVFRHYSSSQGGRSMNSKTLCPFCPKAGSLCCSHSPFTVECSCTLRPQFRAELGC